uniref:Uncharacterized protein n=1 Tax=Anguilla anguilla TaxID=7936 RepID=A0A0E9SSZ3_ANGAN
MIQLLFLDKFYKKKKDFLGSEKLCALRPWLFKVLPSFFSPTQFLTHC